MDVEPVLVNKAQPSELRAEFRTAEGELLLRARRTLLRRPA